MLLVGSLAELEDVAQDGDGGEFVVGGVEVGTGAEGEHEVDALRGVEFDVGVGGVG